MLEKKMAGPELYLRTAVGQPGESDSVIRYEDGVKYQAMVTFIVPKEKNIDCCKSIFRAEKGYVVDAPEEDPTCQSRRAGDITCRRRKSLLTEENWVKKTLVDYHEAGKFKKSGEKSTIECLISCFNSTKVSSIAESRTARAAKLVKLPYKGKTAKPTKPAKPAKPIYPMKPVKTAKPAQSAKTAKPAWTGKPAKTTAVVKTIKPAKEKTKSTLPAGGVGAPVTTKASTKTNTTTTGIIPGIQPSTGQKSTISETASKSKQSSPKEQVNGIESSTIGITKPRESGEEESESSTSTDNEAHKLLNDKGVISHQFQKESSSNTALYAVIMTILITIQVVLVALLVLSIRYLRKLRNDRQNGKGNQQTAPSASTTPADNNTNTASNLQPAASKASAATLDLWTRPKM
ncbi:hypothetical protein Y032_0101g3412 [Ancylostoma ceylanicum]|uniref:Uncharacterized protein n=2 Tax=Ancylostoma ceylanicum TaxID=53326 RepID=A0A016TH33_9BILA|nr:hypothetical protein Y032_0101g3412 [Ancylostoma ceylanicum]